MTKPTPQRPTRPAAAPAQRNAPTGSAVAPVRPPDQDARDRIESVFDRNFLVEAGAGSGKTRSLARRMAAGIAAGVYDIEAMAAVTFTRKAAAELRGRFQEALEDRLRHATDHDERARLENALGNIERLFAGTIHAFCARLLRERPVEARMAPGFGELDELEDAALRNQSWRDFVVEARARHSPELEALKRVGLRPHDLDGAFAIVCQHEDVEFPPGDAPSPDPEPVWLKLHAFATALAHLVPNPVDADARCRLLSLAPHLVQRVTFAMQHRRDASSLADLLTEVNGAKLVKKWWAPHGEETSALVQAFLTKVAEPFITAWRHHVYGVAMRVLVLARSFYAATRKRQNVVNYVDLLVVTSRVLRENRAVREGLGRRYRWFFIDEFQDTDPIQAEIFLMLGAEAGSAGGGRASAGGSTQEETPLDPWSAPLRPGSLFVVGDPKQSIYRFRRADIDIYTRVLDRIRAGGGEVLPLTANWRSLPGVCALANAVFPAVFPREATPESPAFEPLAPMRSADAAHQGPCVARLVVPANLDKKEKDAKVAYEAAQIARYIHAEVAAGRRTYGSFLILTRYRTRLALYAEALDVLEIPVEVSGAGRFGGSEEVSALSLLLQALADPLDGPSIVGVLRGPLFGISDPELFRFAARGGQFELNAPLVGEDADRLFAAEERDAPDVDPAIAASYGPALAALVRMRAWRSSMRRLPLPAAVDRILEDSGWLALAAAGSPGGARAGDLLQAIDVVRAVVEGGGGLAHAADALVEDEDVSNEVETLPLEPGRRDVVRLMNLHKAKGLEADVVFLADAAHGSMFPVDLRIEREHGTTPRGYIKITRDTGNWGKPTIAEPVGWEVHCARETRYREAEIHRLLYVASTRARDLLVVGQCEPGRRGDPNEAWGELNRGLAGAPALEVLPEPTLAAPPPVDLSSSARERARADRDARHEAAAVASWQVASVTGEHPVVRMRANRIRESILGEPGRDEDDTSRSVVSYTATEHVDAGVAWGSLVHGLLEHAMRRDGATRTDLERLARWLTVEQPELRPAIPDAIDVIEAVRREPFWADARRARERHVEVPFAVRIDTPAPQGPGLGPPGADLRGRRLVQRSLFDEDNAAGAPDLSHVPAVPAPASNPQSRPTVLRGVIDLVYSDADGWRIVDYKTDHVVDMRELVARHGTQVQRYREAWTGTTSQPVAAAGLFSVRRLRLEWLM